MINRNNRGEERKKQTNQFHYIKQISNHEFTEFTDNFEHDALRHQFSSLWNSQLCYFALNGIISRSSYFRFHSKTISRILCNSEWTKTCHCNETCYPRIISNLFCTEERKIWQSKANKIVWLIRVWTQCVFMRLQPSSAKCICHIFHLNGIRVQFHYSYIPRSSHFITLWLCISLALSSVTSARSHPTKRIKSLASRSRMHS